MAYVIDSTCSLLQISPKLLSFTVPLAAIEYPSLCDIMHFFPFLLLMITKHPS